MPGISHSPSFAAIGARRSAASRHWFNGVFLGCLSVDQRGENLVEVSPKSSAVTRAKENVTDRQDAVFRRCC